MDRRTTLLIAVTVVLAGCGSDRPPGDVLYYVRGVGMDHSQTFTVDDGSYLIGERSQPASCITSVDIVGSDGRTVATLKPKQPAPASPAFDSQDPDFSSQDVSLSRGTYEAVGKAGASCQWVVKVALPPEG